MKKYVSMLCLGLIVAAGTGWTANVTLTASDGFNESSFNSGLHWSDGLAPSAGNDYIVPSGLIRLRTPADAGSYTFGGDSLRIQGGAWTDPANNNWGFCYKGSDTAGTSAITVDNLILDGGQIMHLNGNTHYFNLYGNINVASASNIYAKQGPIHVYSAISGSATITNPGADVATNILFIRSASNTFTGSIVNDGRLELVDDAVLNFVIGANGVNNGVSGAGASTAFNGDFVFDLLNAGSTLGDSWTIASAVSQVFGSTFTVAGFTDMGGDLWSADANNVTYQFDESTGVLSVVPEPATLVLLGLGGLLLRKRS